METMTPQEVIQLTTTIVMALMAICTFFIGRMTTKHNEGKDTGQITSDMGYLKSGVDDIKRKQEQQEAKEEARHLEVVERLTSVEASTEQAHHRIDRLESKETIK